MLGFIHLFSSNVRNILHLLYKDETMKINENMLSVCEIRTIFIFADFTSYDNFSI